jgi:hypothetical protein
MILLPEPEALRETYKQHLSTSPLLIPDTVCFQARKAVVTRISFLFITVGRRWGQTTHKEPTKDPFR